MAQFLGKGVMVLGVVWALFCLAVAPRRHTDGCADTKSACANRLSAPALLGAVLLFALGLPALGLVITAGLAAGLAAIGAGERKPLALLVTVFALMGLTLAIGLTVLPPTAPLWPEL